MKFRNIVFSAALALGLPALAQAQSFACISTPSDCNAAQGLLSWSLTGNVVTISNVAGSTNKSFIRNVFFDTPTGSLVSYKGGTGVVAFQSGSNPANLPGGNGMANGFYADSSWSAINPKGSKVSRGLSGHVNSVDAGESVSFTLTGITLANFTNGTARIGAHLQGLQGGASASLVSSISPVSPVPEPETYALLLAGLGLIGVVARRRKAPSA